MNHVEIFVDGRKQCDTAPCMVDQVSAGPHEVKVLADGYDAPPVQTVDVESRKDSTAAPSRSALDRRAPASASPARSRA